ncbi:MAG: RNA polymerase sigma-70 factor [Ferruginibacter sp.]
MNNDSSIKYLQEQVGIFTDMKAYEQLYKLLFNGLFRFSFSIVKSKEVAEEIVSDVFIKLWQMESRITEINNLKTYLYTITKNFSLNYLTRSYKQIGTNLEDCDFDAFISFNGPEEIYISEENVKKIKSVIMELPVQCRAIFQLVKEEGLSYQEVASILNISVFTVRNQLVIAIKKLAENLTLIDFKRYYFPSQFSKS